jgi:branched-subunit amino acid transport protein AzlD
MRGSDMRHVHEWFLHRGLPLVLARRVRSRALTERSAPMVAGIGAVISLTMVLAELPNGDPDYGIAIRLGVLALLLVAAPFALFLLHRSGTTLGEAGRRSATLLVMALFVFGLPFADSGFSGIAAAEIVGFAFVAVLAIWLTYVGIGSIVLWGFRFAWVQLGALGTLMSRTLPLLMLTVVVYFTGELWQLAARLTRKGSGRQSDSSPWLRSSSW